jgi:hypothetical protein
MEGFCYFCGKTIEVEGRVGRSDACPYCRGDLHSCVQCRFYDAGAYNQCSEPQAERVLEKEKSNYCDYFEFSGRKREDGRKVETLSKLKGLFKK